MQVYHDFDKFGGGQHLDVWLQAPVASEEAVFRIHVAVTGEKHAMGNSDLR